MMSTSETNAPIMTWICQWSKGYCRILNFWYTQSKAERYNLDILLQDPTLAAARHNHHNVRVFNFCQLKYSGNTSKRSSTKLLTASFLSCFRDSCFSLSSSTSLWWKFSYIFNSLPLALIICTWRRMCPLRLCLAAQWSTSSNVSSPFHSKWCSLIVTMANLLMIGQKSSGTS